MAFTSSPQEQAGAEGTGWVFQVPPGWPAPPAGWQPPPGWQPDPSWPPPPSGWEFWRPSGETVAVPGSEIRVTLDGRPYAFQPGQLARIGRSTDNDVVVSYPAVSRKHAQLSWAPDGWLFENVGQAPTFLDGQPITRAVVSGATELALGSAHGPVLRLEPAPAPEPAPSLPVPGPPPAPLSGPPFPGAQAPGPQAPGPPVPDLPAPGPQAPWPPAPPAPRPAGSRPGPGPAAESAGDELVAAFRILIPIRSWLTNPGWRQGLRLLVIAYALLPLVFIAVFASSGNLTTPGWAYSLYTAPLWAIGFWLLIRPGPIRKLEIQVGIGIIIWTAVWMNVVTININDHLGKPGQALSFPAAIGVGLNEEITKALPILLAGLILLKFRSVKLDPKMWMFLGTIAGLTFGVFEAALYTSQEILIINHAQVASEAVTAVLSFAERVFVDGFQHAVWAGISAFFIGMGINYPRRRVPLVLLGVAIPAALHAVNDWSAGAFNSYWVWIVIQALSLFLFLGYTMSATSIERQVRQAPMFRGESLIMEAFKEPKDADT
jgi:RsiW-degrading membrane proteinase PrsW (M82 family)